MALSESSMQQLMDDTENDPWQDPRWRRAVLLYKTASGKQLTAAPSTVRAPCPLGPASEPTRT